MGQRQAAAAVGGIRTDMRGHDSMLFSVWCAWSQFPGHSTGAHTHTQARQHRYCNGSYSTLVWSETDSLTPVHWCLD